MTELCDVQTLVCNDCVFTCSPAIDFQLCSNMFVVYLPLGNVFNKIQNYLPSPSVKGEKIKVSNKPDKWVSK